MHPFFEAYLSQLAELHRQIEQALTDLPPAALDWSPGPQMNSIAVLITHTAGAERYLLGDLLAGQPTGRDRLAEFETRGQSAAELLEKLAGSRAFARDVLASMAIDELSAPRTLRNGRQVAAAWALLHVLDHTGEHLGHIEMTRQLWGKPPAA